jgi:hypothetical protein
LFFLNHTIFSHIRVVIGKSSLAHEHQCSLHTKNLETIFIGLKKIENNSRLCQSYTTRMQKSKCKLIFILGYTKRQKLILFSRFENVILLSTFFFIFYVVQNTHDFQLIVCMLVVYSLHSGLKGLCVFLGCQFLKINTRYILQKLYH